MGGWVEGMEMCGDGVRMEETELGRRESVRTYVVFVRVLDEMDG